MKIDPDNLIFNELEEAQKRNEELIKNSNEKITDIIMDNDCEDSCKI